MYHHLDTLKLRRLILKGLCWFRFMLKTSVISSLLSWTTVGVTWSSYKNADQGLSSSQKNVIGNTNFLANTNFLGTAKSLHFRQSQRPFSKFGYRIMLKKTCLHFCILEVKAGKYQLFNVTFDIWPSLKVQFLINCSSGFEVSLYLSIYRKEVSNKFLQQIRNWRKIPYGFVIAVLFSSSTCVTSDLLLAFCSLHL